MPGSSKPTLPPPGRLAPTSRQAAAQEQPLDPSRTITQPDIRLSDIEDAFESARPAPAPQREDPWARTGEPLQPFSPNTLGPHSIGRESTAIKKLQQALTQIKRPKDEEREEQRPYLDSRLLTPNRNEWGAYLKPTLDAVKQFQQDNGLPATGMADPKTQLLIRTKASSVPMPTRMVRWQG